MSDDWYYADDRGSIGPVSYERLSKALAASQNPRDALVWCARFPYWVRAKDVPELRARMRRPAPPKNPTTDIGGQPTWQVPRWWYVVCLPCVGGGIGNRIGRAEMGRMSALRSQARQAQRQAD